MHRTLFNIFAWMKNDHRPGPLQLLAGAALAATFFLVACGASSPSATAADQKATPSARQSAATVAVKSQAPKIPESQAKVCGILENWRLRDGYAPGAEPKAPDPNPIKAAQAPPPPDPGNVFDQLIAILGPSGTVIGWKGDVAFSVEDKFVDVSVDSYCPDDGRGLMFRSKPRYRAPLKSPIAEFLSRMDTSKCNKAPESQLIVCPDELLTFSAHLFYNAATRFYETSNFLPFPPRQGVNPTPFSGSPSKQYLDHGPPMFSYELTDISK